MSKKNSQEGGKKILVQNKKARFEYHIIETFEAGIVLTGAEIKSVRLGEINIAESYVRPDGGEFYLIGSHIKPYVFAADREYDPIRKRKLLLHKHEIEKLRTKVEAKGLTVVPLSLYLKNGFAKVELALAKGKSAPDKRDSIRSRESEREVARAMKSKKG